MRLVQKLLYKIKYFFRCIFYIYKRKDIKNILKALKSMGIKKVRFSRLKYIKTWRPNSTLFFKGKTKAFGRVFCKAFVSVNNYEVEKGFYSFVNDVDNVFFPKCYMSFSNDSTHVLCLEYLYGFKSINNLNSDEQISFDIFISWAKKLLVFAKQNNIHFNDISANNIMVKGQIVKLIDFEASVFPSGRQPTFVINANDAKAIVDVVNEVYTDFDTQNNDYIYIVNLSKNEKII